VTRKPKKLNKPKNIVARYVKHQKLLLKTHPKFSEKWVQERIAEDPSILGLGELILKDQERNQPGAGRLDLLLQDPYSNLRYEVEIQLGKTDECHIFRAIEYWDLERKRYPQYDHVAVLIAEDITSRFLNIISLLNGFIPLVAIQLNAIEVGNQIALIFTVVLDQRLGFAPEEEEEQEDTDRSYWEKRSSKATVCMADEILLTLKTLDKELELKYNKFYIGVSKDEKPFNFVIFRPRKTSLRVELKLKKADEIEIMLESAGLDVMEYDARNQRYRIILTKNEIKKHERLLKELMGRAYREFNGYILE
jgi:predicted transport protein